MDRKSTCTLLIQIVLLYARVAALCFHNPSIFLEVFSASKLILGSWETLLLKLLRAINVTHWGVLNPFRESLIEGRKNPINKKHINTIFTGLSPDSAGIFLRDFLAIFFMCFPLSPNTVNTWTDLIPTHSRDNPEKLFMFIGCFVPRVMSVIFPPAIPGSEMK